MNTGGNSNRKQEGCQPSESFNIDNYLISNYLIESAVS